MVFSQEVFFQEGCINRLPGNYTPHSLQGGKVCTFYAIMLYGYTAQYVSSVMARNDRSCQRTDHQRNDYYRKV